MVNNKEKIRNTIEFAQAVMDEYNKQKRNFPNINAIIHPIFDVIKILANNIQAEYFSHLLYEKEHENKLEQLSRYKLFFGNEDIIDNKGTKVMDVIEKIENVNPVEISKIAILPWPWNRDRLIDNIATIGEGRNGGAWKEYSINHNVEIMLPLGLTWVIGGNHSISTGILQGQGKVTPKYAFDISKLYKYIEFDGDNLIRKGDKSIIRKVNNFEIGAIFEIGRLIVENDIQFFNSDK